MVMLAAAGIWKKGDSRKKPMITKKRKAAQVKIDNNKQYTLAEAAALVKDINCTKFDSSVDVHIRLGIDPKKADQALRGTVSLPHGTGTTKRYARRG